MKFVLPNRVTLLVNLGKNPSFNFLDIFITMPLPADGTRGHCGKADGDLSDDTKKAFVSSMSENRVSAEESLFNAGVSLAALADSSTQPTELEEGEEEGEGDGCVEGSDEEALALCANELPAGTSQSWLEVCATDVCAGGPEMADHTMDLAEQAEEVAEEVELQEQVYAEEQAARAVAQANQAVVSCHTCATGEACFNDVRWALQYGIPNGYYKEKGKSSQMNELTCFEEAQLNLWMWQHDPEFVVGGMMEKSMARPCAGQSAVHTKNGLKYCR